MLLIIDRIEEITAICEDMSQNRREFELSKLPRNIKEGDVLDYEDGIFRYDPEETHKRRRRIQKLMDEVFE